MSPFISPCGERGPLTTEPAVVPPHVPTGARKGQTDLRLRLHLPNAFIQSDLERTPYFFLLIRFNCFNLTMIVFFLYDL